jgi:hypothetical protein
MVYHYGGYRLIDIFYHLFQTNINHFFFYARMIKKSFVLLEGVGPRSEERIWSQRIHTWDDFLEAKSVGGFSQSRKSYCDRRLEVAKSSLIARDSSYFVDKLRSSESWRLYDFFKDDCAFLDIETTGYYGDITVVGVFDGRETKTLVKGFNLDKENLRRALGDAKLLVTFNGQSFDVPVINRYFDGVMPNIPHLDLRFALAKLGLRGGLKSIEHELGIKRCAEVEGIDGNDAVILWQMYKRTGEREYLDKIVKYNEEDIINLRPLADFAYSKLSERVHDIMRQ